MKADEKDVSKKEVISLVGDLPDDVVDRMNALAEAYPSGEVKRELVALDEFYRFFMQ